MTITVVTNMHKTSMSCHDYEGVMSVLYTPIQVKCYQNLKSLLTIRATREKQKIDNNPYLKKERREKANERHTKHGDTGV